jgi:electron transfer flavoprotein beta subunit
MKIVVCVKQVPDSAAHVTVENGEVTWHDAPLVINPWDEYAVEAALTLIETYAGDVIAVSFGSESSKEALKHALAMGCSEAILIPDQGQSNYSASQLYSSDLPRLLAAAIQKIGEVDLVIMGRQAIDDDLGITAAQVSRLLRWPALTLVSQISSVDPITRKIQVERATEEGRQVVESPLPAVISVVKDIGEPRYPSFMGIRKAQRVPIPSWSPTDLGLTIEEPVFSWVETINPPQRQLVNEMITGKDPQEIAEKLVEKIMLEGVL